MIMFRAVLGNDLLEEMADIIGDQADRLNNGQGDDPMFRDIEFLLDWPDENGSSLRSIVTRWCDEQNADEAKPQ